MVAPPARTTVAFTRSLVPITVTTTLSTIARTISLRSVTVVVFACHSPVMSLARAVMVCRSAGGRTRGWYG